jgi:hypothetical protein
MHCGTCSGLASQGSSCASALNVISISPTSSASALNVISISPKRHKGQLMRISPKPQAANPKQSQCARQQMRAKSNWFRV